MTSSANYKTNKNIHVSCFVYKERNQYMKLRALSSYDGDKDTRFGDCILIYDNSTLIVYDCGHERHANEVKNFLQKNYSINRIHIVISHNDKDHTNGVINLLDYLYENGYTVTLYSSLYLKNTKEVLEILDDERRTPKATREHILEIFDKICDIVQKAEEYNFSVINAEANTSVSLGTIVGPKVDEFAGVVAAAIDTNNAGAKIDGETVMNAASVQLKIKLDNAQIVLLCGDATPKYLHNLDRYDIIQLPHHGKLESAKLIFEKLDDPYSKIYLVSDNTGSGETSGGSDKLADYMEEENFDSAKNTKDGIVNIPENTVGIIGSNSGASRGVRLGEVDYRGW